MVILERETREMSSEFVFSAQGEPSFQHTKKPPDPPKTKTSFRDKLLGSPNVIPTHEKEDLIEKQLVRIELENGN